jgi:hypothetical protein
LVGAALSGGCYFRVALLRMARGGGTMRGMYMRTAASLLLSVLPVAVTHAGEASSFADRVYDEDFSYGNDSTFSVTNGWTTGYSTDRWSITDAGVHANTDSSGGTWGSAGAADNHLTQRDEVFSDFELGVTFTFGDDDAQGLVFRYTSPTSYYLFFVTQDTGPSTSGASASLYGAYLYRVSGGTAVLLDNNAAISYSIEESWWGPPPRYDVSIVAVGDNIQVYFDGDQDGLDAADLWLERRSGWVSVRRGARLRRRHRRGRHRRRLRQLSPGRQPQPDRLGWRRPRRRVRHLPARGRPGPRRPRW